MLLRGFFSLFSFFLTSCLKCETFSLRRCFCQEPLWASCQMPSDKKKKMSASDISMCRNTIVPFCTGHAEMFKPLHPVWVRVTHFSAPILLKEEKYILVLLNARFWLAGSNGTSGCGVYINMLFPSTLYAQLLCKSVFRPDHDLHAYAYIPTPSCMNWNAYWIEAYQVMCVCVMREGVA